MFRIYSTSAAVLTAVALLGGSAAALDPTQEKMGAYIEMFQSGSAVKIGESTIAAVNLIPDLYSRRDFTLAWTDPARVDELLRLVEGSAAEGLTPADYHAGELRGLIEAVRATRRPDPDSRVRLDLLLTDSLIRMGYHLMFGKIDPRQLDSDWNLKREWGEFDPAAITQAAIDADSIEQYMDGFLDRGFMYYRLKSTLAEYRELEAAGGWPAIPAGATLKPGMQDPRVPLLRKRLVIPKDLDAAADTGSDLYDDAVQAAVKRFQYRHGIDADGAVGPQTLAALNVTAAERVQQIRVNLERARWVFPLDADDFVAVNIAGFKTFLVRDNNVVWETRVQVGKPYHKTPVIKSKVQYLVLNPTWTPTPNITFNELLPREKREPGYLASKNISAIDRSGKAMDPGSLNWASFSRRNFPYTLRQGPGPGNALGRVKFIFPNSHFVYLHDTPSKSLFDRSGRAFSHGCIRTEDPLKLAELLLEDNENWDRAKIDAVVDSGKTTTVMLEEPMAVMLLYWTVSVEREGTVVFYEDVYERDQRILEGLNRDFVFRLPEGLPAAYTE